MERKMKPCDRLPGKGSLHHFRFITMLDKQLKWFWGELSLPRGEIAEVTSAFTFLYEKLRDLVTGV